MELPLRARDSETSGTVNASRRRALFSRPSRYFFFLSRVTSKDCSCLSTVEFIFSSLKSLRDVLAEREKVLLAELSRQEAASANFFDSHKKNFDAIRTKAAVSSAF